MQILFRNSIIEIAEFSRSEVLRNDYRSAILGAQYLRSTSKPTRFVDVYSVNLR